VRRPAVVADIGRSLLQRIQQRQLIARADNFRHFFHSRHQVRRPALKFRLAGHEPHAPPALSQPPAQLDEPIRRPAFVPASAAGMNDNGGRVRRPDTANPAALH